MDAYTNGLVHSSSPVVPLQLLLRVGKLSGTTWFGALHGTLAKIGQRHLSVNLFSLPHAIPA